MAECGRRQPPGDSSTPAQMWSQAHLPCLLAGQPQSCYKKGQTESVRRWQSGLGGGPPPHTRSWGPSMTRVPALSRYRNHVGAGAGWGRAGPTLGKRTLLWGRTGSEQRFLAWAPLGFTLWSGIYMGLPGLQLPGALAGALASRAWPVEWDHPSPRPTPASACEDRARPNRKHGL